MSGIDDYPEHLNPFRERRGSLIRSSFRGLFNTLRRKKPDKRPSVLQSNHIGSPPTIRKHSTVQDSSYRKTVPAYLPHQKPSPVPLPRYRPSQILPKPGEGKDYNPFDEDEVKEKTVPDVIETPASPTPDQDPSQKNQSQEVLTPRTEIRRSHRKKKRRAPMPPGQKGDSNLLNVSGSQCNSQWSLTSEYSEYSSYGSEYGDEADPNSIPLEASEDLLNITRAIGQLNDDSNNNIVKETKEVNKEANVVNENPENASEDKVTIVKVRENEAVVKENAIETKTAVDTAKESDDSKENVANIEEDTTSTALNESKENEGNVVVPISNNDSQIVAETAIKTEDKVKICDNVTNVNTVTKDIAEKPAEDTKKPTAKLAKRSSIDELDEFDKDLEDEQMHSFKESMESIKNSIEKDLDIEKEVNVEKDFVTSTPIKKPKEFNNDQICNDETPVKTNGDLTSANDNKYSYKNDDDVEIRTKDIICDDGNEEFRMSIKDRIGLFEEASEKASDSLNEDTPIPKMRTKKLNRSNLLGS